MWEMSSSSVHLTVRRHDQRSLSEMRCAYFTSTWTAEHSVWLQCLWGVCGVHALYSGGAFSFSRICWEQYVNATSFVLPRSASFSQVRVQIYIKISLAFKRTIIFHLFVSRGSEGFCVSFQNTAYSLWKELLKSSVCVCKAADRLRTSPNGLQMSMTSEFQVKQISQKGLWLVTKWGKLAKSKSWNCVAF